VGLVETGAFELDRWRGNQLSHVAAALWAVRVRGIGDLLDDLDTLTALRTLVFVKRHCCTPLSISQQGAVERDSAQRESEGGVSGTTFSWEFASAANSVPSRK